MGGHHPFERCGADWNIEAPTTRFAQKMRFISLGRISAAISRMLLTIKKGEKKPKASQILPNLCRVSVRDKLRNDPKAYRNCKQGTQGNRGTIRNKNIRNPATRRR
jgi:hypothetical protein